MAPYWPMSRQHGRDQHRSPAIARGRRTPIAALAAWKTADSAKPMHPVVDVFSRPLPPAEEGVRTSTARCCKPNPTVGRCLPSRCKTKQMPTITVTPDIVTVRLSTAEKAGALHGDLSIPRSAIVAATVVQDP